MRHGKKFNHLGRTAPHRKAMLANMASSLIEHKRINTTVAKAKALRTYIEPLITKAKTDTTHSRRVVFQYLQNKYAVKELFGDVSVKVADRPGGYCRIIRTGFRKGDGAEMALIELVDYNDIYTTDKPEKKTRRSRRRGGKKKTEETVAETTVEVANETVEEVKEEVQSTTEAVAERAEEVVAEATEEATPEADAAEEKSTDEKKETEE